VFFYQKLADLKNPFYSRWLLNIIYYISPAMKRAIFIGQAMPKIKKDPHDWSSLNAWLYTIGITDQIIKDNFFYSALVDYFPGLKGHSHRIPTPQEITKERDRLEYTMKSFSPEIVVPIGRLSIAHCLSQDVQPLIGIIGKAFLADPYKLLDRELPIVPLPHPSGASTWHYKKENKMLLTKALQLLKRNLLLI